MSDDTNAAHLSGIATMWTVLRQAHAGPGDAADEAKRVLLERYGGAVRRYLLKILRDPHAADDLTQEFAVSLLSGRFHAADPARGRFRNYVKTALFHLVSRQTRQRNPVAADSGVLAAVAAPAEADRDFAESWRAELLARAWAALARAHPVQNAILQYKAAHPDVTSEEIARRLGRQVGQPLTADNVRQLLKRGRALFAELLVEQVAHTLESPTPDEVEAELAELSLLTFVRPTGR